MGTKTEKASSAGAIFMSPMAPESLSAPAVIVRRSLSAAPAMVMRFEALAKP